MTSLASALPSLSLKKRHCSASKDGIFTAVLKSRKPHWPSALPSLSLKKRHRSASKDGREFLQHRNNLPPNTGRTSERLALFVLRQGPSVQSVLMPVMGASFKRQWAHVHAIHVSIYKIASRQKVTLVKLLTTGTSADHGQTYISNNIIESNR